MQSAASRGEGSSPSIPIKVKAQRVTKGTWQANDGEFVVYHHMRNDDLPSSSP